MQIKIHHKFRKHGCAFMLEFGIFGAGVLFLFYLFCFKTPFGKDFRKIEKRIKKRKKKENPQPSPVLFPQPLAFPHAPAHSLRPNCAARASPSPSPFSLIAGPLPPCRCHAGPTSQRLFLPFPFFLTPSPSGTRWKTTEQSRLPRRPSFHVVWNPIKASDVAPHSVFPPHHKTEP